MTADLTLCGNQTRHALFPDVTLTCKRPVGHKTRWHKDGDIEWGNEPARICGHQSLTKPLTCQLPPHHSERLHQEGNMKWGEAPPRRPDTRFGVETKITEPAPLSTFSRFRAWINPSRTLALMIFLFMFIFLASAFVPSVISGYSVGQSLLITLAFLVGVLSLIGLVTLAMRLLEKE